MKTRRSIMETDKLTDFVYSLYYYMQKQEIY